MQTAPQDLNRRRRVGDAIDALNAIGADDIRALNDGTLRAFYGAICGPATTAEFELDIRRWAHRDTSAIRESTDTAWPTAPLTLDAAMASGAFLLDGHRVADRWCIGEDEDGHGLSARYCNDCGARVDTDLDDGCPLCGFGQPANDDEAEDMESPMDFEDRLDALLKLED